MNIVKLTSENVKRLTAVEITPKGNVVVIGGKNGQGKSSVLDSIFWTIAGDPGAKMPVRRGEEKAKTVVDLGEIIVKRTFTAAGGTSLVVTNADGARQASPQEILNKLTGKLTFDPLEFARQKPEAQAATLRKLVNLDFTDVDKKHGELYAKRTEINREAAQLKARFEGMPRHEGLPAEEVPAQTILEEQEKAAKKNADNQKIRNAVTTAQECLEGADEKIGALEAEILAQQDNITDLENTLANAKATLTNKQTELKTTQSTRPTLDAVLTDAKAKSDALKDEDLSKFRVKLQEVEQTNLKIRQSKQRAELVTQYKAKSDAAEKLTTEMEKLESNKRKATTEAKYPVDGLLFETAGGITLNGIPFEQCSSAEQLRVSLSIAFALNPKLKIVLIRDGSLLDDDSMVVLAEMAKAAGAQVWMERVGTDAHTSVVIEDGHVAEAQPEPEGKLL